MNKKEITFFHALLNAAASPSLQPLLDACGGPHGAACSRRNRETEEKTMGEAKSLASCWLARLVLVAKVDPKGDC